MNDVGLKYLTIITVNGEKLNYIIDGSEPNSEDFSDYMSEDIVENNTLKEKFTKQEIGYSEMYKDEVWGYLLSAVAPIKDSKGEIVAWVEADMSVKDIRQSINIFIIRLALVLFFALVVLFIMIRFINKNITHPIEKFVESFQKLVQGDFSSRVEFKQKGVFKLLADEYNTLVIIANIIRHANTTLVLIAIILFLVAENISFFIY